MRNYSKYITQEEKRKMTSYLKLDSCKKIVGPVNPDSVTKKKQIVLYAIATIIFAIGMISIFF